MTQLRRVLARHNRRTAGVLEGATDWHATLKRRVRVIAAVLGFWAFAIQAQLVHLQVFRHADLVARAERQQMSTRPTPAKRGDLLDRRGRVLATSVDADSIYAVPSA